MDGKSLPITEERIKELKKIFPEVFSENRVDFDRLRNILGDNVKDKDERYNLSWAGKSDAYRILQQPSFATLIPQKEESVDFDKTDNIFIEGENLEVLKILQRSYFNKIKMIYIDPPYNTGKDSFIYPDKFSETKKDYQQRIGVKDEEGKLLKEGEFNLNSKENGQYHSNWLNMMMPRLFLAKNLLKEDGVIFVSIDDNEVHNIKLLMNEIFGEENFIYQLSVVNNLNGNDNSSGMMETQEHCLIYAKNKESFVMGVLPIEEDEESDWQKDELGYWKVGRNLKATGINAPREARPNLFFPIYINEETLEFTLEEKAGAGWYHLIPLTEGKEMSWYWSKETFKSDKNEVIVKKTPEGYSLYKKQRPSLGDLPSKRGKTTFYSPKYANANSNSEVKQLFNGIKLFDYSKASQLIKDFISLSNTSDEDIILDFFAGSGTTGHALMKLNSEDEGTRKFILVQLPEICKDDSVAKKNGYNTIAEICKERLRRAGKKIKEDITAQNVDTGFKVFELQESNFKQWKEVDNEKDLSEQLEMFVDDIKDKNINEINILYEIIIKHGYNLNSTIEKRENLYFVSDKSDNKQMLACLNGEINKELISQITQSGVKNIVVLDRLFKGNDCLKTNMYLEMKDNDINFECI
ncbi:MAG: site-specific DNA-methyltransferase [Bacteroidales bacterium]|nr:site-specific DNA-methyltransferase [Bacteroidales bacterium]